MCEAAVLAMGSYLDPPLYDEACSAIYTDVLALILP